MVLWEIMISVRKLAKKDFPSRLLQINDPPKELWLQGKLPDDRKKYVCVVGSRKYSSYGKEACQKIIAGLAGHPIVIVSGLALGIDGIAHQSALQSGLATIAVPGSGLDKSVLYPYAHHELAKKILEAGGALLSEYEPTFRATEWSFPRRNRIMAGLSDVTLVVEAGIKSGTLITSKLATEYNRDVGAVPGSIFSSGSEGPHMLLRIGATPVTSSKDILTMLGMSGAEATVARSYEDCSPAEKKVVKILEVPTEKDDLIRAMGMPIGEAQMVLSVMELKGLIKESMGEIRLT